MTDDLQKTLDQYRPLFNIGINSDPLLHAILELIDSEYEKGYTDGWTDKSENSSKVSVLELPESQYSSNRLSWESKVLSA